MLSRLFAIIILITVSLAATVVSRDKAGPDQVGQPHFLAPFESGTHSDRSVTLPDWHGLGAVPLGQQRLLGFAVNAHHIGRLPLYLDAVDRIADLGANALIVVTPWFQRTAEATIIRHVPDKGPTRDQLLAILQRAQERGLHTTLLPIVLIEQPAEGDWRGLIRPTDWDSWWRSYHRFIDFFAALATEAHVDLLSVGSELNSTEFQTQRWQETIHRARSQYGGRLTYSANWDRYRAVTFWDRLDAISVSAYFELERDHPGAPLEKLIAAWEAERNGLLAFAWLWQRPVILSEVGYPSLPWANAHPWNYVGGPDDPADHALQARCWDAFFAAWAPVLVDQDAWLGGFHCYYWDPYHRGGPRDTGYGVAGKPAEQVIQRGFAETRQRAGRYADLNEGGRPPAR